ELFPAIALAGERAYVVWQAFTRGFDDDSGTIELASFDLDGAKLGGDTRVDGDASAPAAGRWLPSLAVLGGGEPFGVWIDERDAGPDGVSFEHVYAARGHDRGTRFDPPVRVDDGQPTPLAASLDNKWSPTVAVIDGRIHAAWTDFREYNWDIFATRSLDGGK